MGDAGQTGDATLKALWGVETATTRGPKPRWTLSEVADATVRVADAGGLPSVSLARVATELGLTTTALYRYVASKEALVTVAVDAAIGDVPPLVGASWQDRCRSWANHLADRYREHPWLLDYRPAGLPEQPRSLGWIEALIDAVDEPAVDAFRLALLLDGLARSFGGIADAPPRDVPWLRDAVAARYPRVAAAIGDRTSDPTGEFALAVDVVLAGTTRGAGQQE